MWLVVYEATKKGWWFKAKPSGFVAAAPFFQDLWAKDVEFYDPKRKARRRISPAFATPPPVDILEIAEIAAGYPE